VPLLEVHDVRATGQDVSGALRGFRLEMPRPGALLDGGVVETWGWALGLEHRAISVEFTHDGRLLRRVPVNLSRADVAAAFPLVPGADCSGFRTEIPIAGRLGEFTIEAVCTLANGQRVPLGVLVVRRRWREASSKGIAGRLVSIVIPCFNQAHYLAEAVESARAQTHPNVEVVVVDDGSPDNVVEVAARCGVRVVSQPRQGLAAARNTGIRRTNGGYLVFLDADDRLMPRAVETGLASLDAHPEAAFTSGRCRWMTSEGSPMATPEHGCPSGDLFAALLRTNYTSMPATVMYRRAVFEVVLGFDVSFHAVEDYELLLRIARQFPICCHDGVVAEYRVRGGSLSGNHAMMLACATRAMRQQRSWAGDSREHRAAYRDGLRFWRQYYGRRLRQQIEGDAQRREWRRAFEGIWSLARFSPRTLFVSET
jgi:hypothetical protein